MKASFKFIFEYENWLYVLRRVSPKLFCLASLFHLHFFIFKFLLYDNSDVSLPSENLHFSDIKNAFIRMCTFVLSICDLLVSGCIYQALKG